MAEAEEYLAVLKASYDYEPQSEDEVKVQEDQILLLLERTDDDWWKVKVKGASPDEEGPSGLVPAAYVEPAAHISVVKAQYEYAAQAAGELTIAEDQTLHAFGAEEEGWLLVQTEDGSRAGYVPANYVEEAGEGAAQEAAPAAASSFANIVIPDSPKRPVSTYNDPEELVASSKTAKPASAPDPVQTWSVTELDKKGKKKKGTLGIGNGALFFASESDKAPVQQFPLAQVGAARLDENKPKHLYIALGGAEAHFNCGDRDTAEDVLYKLGKSRAAAGLDGAAAAPFPAASPAKGKGVRFTETGPAVIPPSPEPDSDEQDAAPANGHGHADADGEPAVALYDFAAQGDDELSVSEGDRLWIVERDSDEWWKVRDARGAEGVVPASYIEPTDPPRAAPAAAAAADSDSEDDGPAQAAAAAAAAAAAEREREAAAKAERKAQKEAEERKQRERARREAERERAAAEEERARREEKERQRRAKEKEKESGHKSKASVEKRGPPPADKVRTWTDRSKQFKVEAAFLGYKNGMIRLHKVNGVIIEVPSEKMSIEDITYIDKATSAQKERVSEDDEPLESRRRSLANAPSGSSSAASTPAKPSTPQQPPKKKGPGIDWFEFFLNAGCDIDDCTRYAASFERDKIDAALLPDVSEGTMRSLGLREGDIIRVRKAIAERGPPKPEKDARRDDSEQIRHDEEVARALQEGREPPKRSTPSPGPPNLFTNPGGGLKNQTRRGRPTKNSSVPTSVAMDGLSKSSETIARTSTPQLISQSPLASSPIQQVPPRTSSAVSSGFDDDAWTNRPSSTKPITPTPAAQLARAPSAPPAQAPAPVAPAAPTPPPAPPAPAAIPRAASAAPAAAPAQKGLGQTTESDIFDQLARLSQLRVSSPAVAPPAPTPPIASPPAGYAAGLGVAGSPAPLGAHLQAQATGAYNGPRGPLAPVPANQGLLAPLVPTQTGFRGFVPTSSPGLLPQATGFQPQQTGFQPQPTGFQPQPTGFNPQPTGFNPQPSGFQPAPSPLAVQPTGFQPQQTGFQPQQTGFQPQGFQPSLQPQQTGFGFQPALQPQATGFNPGFNGGFGGAQSPPPVPPLPAFANGGFGAGVAPQPTGFNPGFGAPPPKDNSPANIFAQMKAGTFGDDSAPQDANKYNALRTNTAPLTAQPTGWGGFGGGGYQGGYNGYQG